MTCRPSALLLLTALLAAAEADATLPAGQSAVGTLRARQVSVLGSQVSGRVQTVLVDVGSRVTTGQELVRLDPVLFRLAVDGRNAELGSAKARAATAAKAIPSAEAEITAVTAERDDAQRNHERMKALWEKPAGQEPSIPRKMYDDAATRLATTQARLAAAEARRDEARTRMAEAEAGIAQVAVALRRAEQDLADSVIKAPFDGVVTRRLVDTGANVASAPPTDVMEVQEVSRLYLECSVSQEQAAGIANGTRLRFRIDNTDREVAVTTVFPQVDAATRSLRLRAEIANGDGTLKPGSLVQVTIIR